jgi:hypothetical protein
MNRSFSKIRHIQEANQKLEKRILSETMEFDVQGQQSNDLDDAFKNEMGNLGYSNVKLADYVDTDNPVCTPQTDNPEHNSILEKVANWASSQTDVNVLKNEVKNLIAKMKSITNKPVAEQVGATAASTGLVIGGSITISPVILGVIGVLILVILVASIARLVSGSRTKYRGGKCSSYHRRGRTNDPGSVLRW